MAQRQDVSRAPPLLSWWSTGYPEAEGALVEGGCPPSLRNWDLVVETLHCLQVAPFPQKLVHGCCRRCSVLSGTQFCLLPSFTRGGPSVVPCWPPPSSGQALCILALFHTPVPLHLGDGGDREACQASTGAKGGACTRLD